MSTDLAQVDPELARLRQLGWWLALSETGKDTDEARGAAAALRLYYAQQLALPPLAAAELSVIKGRLFVSAQLLRALAERNGYRILRKDADDKTCTAVLVDRETGEQIGESTFTYEQAKTAGLVRNGSAWTTHPARMLWARASKNVIVDFAPGVALGIMLDDEAAEVIDGEIVDEGLGGEAQAGGAEPPPGTAGMPVGGNPPPPPNSPGGDAAPAPTEQTVLETSTASEDTPPGPTPKQLERLDPLAAELPEAELGEVLEKAGIAPQLFVDQAGRLDWEDVRTMLTRDEAGRLINELGFHHYAR